MTLDKLHKALTGKTRPEFDTWLRQYGEALSNFIHGSTGQELDQLNFHSFYFKEISTSKIYQDYHTNRNESEEFTFFLNLLGTAAEKLALIGSNSVAKAILVDLPSSAIKLRLEALDEFALVEDIRSDYVAKLPIVLEKLDESRVLYEEGTIRPIVDVLTVFYQKAKKVLKKAKLNDELSRLERMFTDEAGRKKYPFLGHQILEDLLAGKKPFDLHVVNVATECLTPSPEIRNLFFLINRDYFSHPQVDSARDRIFDHTKKFILDHVLVRGRGDFTTSTGRITAKDKVLLYCFFNLKKHFFTSYAVFQKVLGSLKVFFKTSEYKPVFIDLGCGPMTSGLAIADLIYSTTGKGINFSYIGVDIADAMLAKSKSYKSLPIFEKSCSFHFFYNWNEITPTLLAKLAGRNNPILFNASYLFASSSVDVCDLAAYVRQVVKIYDNVYLVFQNPNRVDRNLKYEEFKGLIKHTSLISAVENVRYKAASSEANEDVAYEILQLLNP